MIRAGSQTLRHLFSEFRAAPWTVALAFLLLFSSPVVASVGCREVFGPADAQSRAEQSREISKSFSDWLGGIGEFKTGHHARALLLRRQLEVQPHLSEFFSEVLPEFPTSFGDPVQFKERYISYCRRKGVPEAEILKPGQVAVKKVKVVKRQQPGLRGFISHKIKEYTGRLETTEGRDLTDAVFVPFGESVPAGYEVLQGHMPSKLYHKALLSGVLPISWGVEQHSLFKMFMLYHEMFHAAGFVNTSYRRVVMEILREVENPELDQRILSELGHPDRGEDHARTREAAVMRAFKKIGGDFIEEFWMIPKVNHAPINRLLMKLGNINGEPLSLTSPARFTVRDLYDSLPDQILSRQNVETFNQQVRSVHQNKAQLEAQGRWREVHAQLIEQYKRLVAPLTEIEKELSNLTDHFSIQLGGARADGMSMEAPFYSHIGVYADGISAQRNLGRLMHRFDSQGVVWWELTPDHLVKDLHSFLAGLREAANRNPETELQKFRDQIRLGF